MITSEIKVNGILIGHIHCVNTKIDNMNGETKYRITHYDVDRRKASGYYVYHNRKDGYKELFKKIWGVVVKFSDGMGDEKGAKVPETVS